MEKEDIIISRNLFEKMIKYLMNDGNTYDESLIIIDEFKRSLPKNYPN